MIKEEEKRVSKLVKTITDIIWDPNNLPKRSIFKFKNDDKTATHNTKILDTCNYDYKDVTPKQKGEKELQSLIMDQNLEAQQNKYTKRTG